MNKILCLMVVVAVIAQVYGGAVNDASGKAGSDVKDTTGEVKKAEAPVGKTSGSGNRLSASMGFVKPLMDEARTVVGGGEKEINSMLGLGSMPNL